MKRRHLLAAALAVPASALAAGAAEAQSKRVRLAYVEWCDAVVATNLLGTTPEQKGYTATITPLAAAAIRQAVATGEADAMVAAWLPATHASDYGQLKDRVDPIGPNVEGAKPAEAAAAWVKANPDKVKAWTD